MIHKVRCLGTALSGVRLIEISSSRQFPRHAHDQYGVGIMLDGGHASWSGRGEVEAGPNHVITCSPNEIHDGRPIGSAPRRWSMIFVEPKTVADCLGDAFARREFPQPAIRETKLARRVLFAIKDLTFADTPNASAIIADLFGALLGEPDDKTEKTPLSRGVRLMLERIHDSLLETPSLKELATISGLSTYAALRRFRREVGITPHAYLLQYRGRLAYQAISIRKTLAEAANISGFSDQSHMTRVFVRQFGMTPGQARTLQIRSRQYRQGSDSFGNPLME